MDPFVFALVMIFLLIPIAVIGVIGGSMQRNRNALGVEEEDDLWAGAELKEPSSSQGDRQITGHIDIDGTRVDTGIVKYTFPARPSRPYARAIVALEQRSAPLVYEAVLKAARDIGAEIWFRAGGAGAQGYREGSSFKVVSGTRVTRSWEPDSQAVDLLLIGNTPEEDAAYVAQVIAECVASLRRDDDAFFRWLNERFAAATEEGTKRRIQWWYTQRYLDRPGVAEQLRDVFETLAQATKAQLLLAAGAEMAPHLANEVISGGHDDETRLALARRLFESQDTVFSLEAARSVLAEGGDLGRHAAHELRCGELSDFGVLADAIGTTDRLFRDHLIKAANALASHLTNSAVPVTEVQASYRVFAERLFEEELRVEHEFLIEGMPRAFAALQLELTRRALDDSNELPPWALDVLARLGTVEDVPRLRAQQSARPSRKEAIEGTILRIQERAGGAAGAVSVVSAESEGGLSTVDGESGGLSEA